jgi:hypothetical protein
MWRKALSRFHLKEVMQRFMNRSWFMSANRMGCAQAKAALSKKSGRLYSGKHLSVRKVRLQI